ncbi:sulfotransferase domain-containing protein [Pullulanibacillus sp. KACC 23026]|uniref:sulfotransferase domain-containing protein n=1 Tax=Pullulanibacillus sp. KACC 23026 TaxID=3028315 RepID=UPI0023AF3405|nr:sulfotransferase domain-containing protein [Pullulanibacillus sp. KACC 23026]WEG12876.1 sulfotransferase domain-containing protein [Pullulanibacillus sp. KACC 23026]
MKTIYLHIGYHKTATTFLQRIIFPKLKQLNYINKTGEALKRMNQIRTKKLTKKEIESFRKFINKKDNGKPILISNEGFSGNPLHSKKTKKQFEVLEDLRKIFPPSEFDVHIIVGIREQVSLLTSLYLQYIKMGGVLDGSSFIEHCQQIGVLENFNFFHTLHKIEELFGRDRMYVMVYERFRDQFRDELLQLLNYMGEKEIPVYKDEEQLRNKSLGQLQLTVTRRLNKLFKTSFNPQGKFSFIEVPGLGTLTPRRLIQNKWSNRIHYKSYRFPMDRQTAIKERYETGNRRLSEVYNISLPENYYSGTTENEN